MTGVYDHFDFRNTLHRICQTTIFDSHLITLKKAAQGIHRSRDGLLYRGHFYLYLFESYFGVGSSSSGDFFFLAMISSLSLLSGLVLMDLPYILAYFIFLKKYSYAFL